jgi:LmbE family N-acetylglucosaminyl deacetylase
MHRPVSFLYRSLLGGLMNLTRVRLLASFFILTIAVSSLLQAARPWDPMSSADIDLALRKLGVVGSALYIAAHPDDENTAMIAWLGNEHLLRAGYLSVNRGDGGQNLIGPEQGPALGVIRSEELLAARRIDGGEQFFTRAIDFGYSKNPEETFAIWNREEVLSDFVWIIRNFRPDVLITRFPDTGEGGHGHHTASAILAAEAFEAAGDPSRFPEQLKHVSTWQPARLFWNAWRIQNRPADAPALIAVDLGEFNPILGRSYTELAGASRSMHKSQGFGAPERRGRLLNHLELLAGSAVSSDPLEGIDLSWRRLPGGETVQTLVDAAIASWDRRTPEDLVPHLIRIDEAMAALPQSPTLLHKRGELETLLRASAGLWLEAIASRPLAVAGEQLQATVTLINRSTVPVRVEGVSFISQSGLPLSATFGRAPAGTALEENLPLSVEATIPLPATTQISEPYWLIQPSAEGLARVDDQTERGKPRNDPAVAARLTLDISGRSFSFDVPLTYRWTDRVRGEQYRPLSIAPRVTAAMSDRFLFFPAADSRPVEVQLENHAAGPSNGTFRIGGPAGWRVTPQSVDFALDPGERRRLTFHVSPPSGRSHGRLSAGIRYTGASAAEPARTFQLIDYEHIPMQTLFPRAEVRVGSAAVERRAQRIGYVAGPGDEVARALEQIGYSVDMLSDADVSAGDLSQYDAIVTGVRAFNTREVLKRDAARLFDYVAAGGTLVVQYNTSDATLAPQIAPLPLRIGRDRVTDQRSPVTFLQPQHPLLTAPNQITSADFEGWVQERGLYFAGERAAGYESVLAMNDPGEPPLDNGIVLLRHGEGTYIYTGLSFFRQLPAAVPGAYRLLANLVEQGKVQE